VGAWKRTCSNPGPRKAPGRTTTYVTERLALRTEALGSPQIAWDIAGSFNPGVWFGPGPRRISVRSFSDANRGELPQGPSTQSRPVRSRFHNRDDAVEPAQPLRTNTLTLIKACRSSGVRSPSSMFLQYDEHALRGSTTTNAAVIHECFAKLGRWDYFVSREKDSPVGAPAI